MGFYTLFDLTEKEEFCYNVSSSLSRLACCQGPIVVLAGEGLLKFYL
jgi:hypothetical protein